MHLNFDAIIKTLETVPPGWNYCAIGFATSMEFEVNCFRSSLDLFNFAGQEKHDRQFGFCFCRNDLGWFVYPGWDNG